MSDNAQPPYPRIVDQFRAAKTMRELQQAADACLEEVTKLSHGDLRQRATYTNIRNAYGYYLRRLKQQN